MGGSVGFQIHQSGEKPFYGIAKKALSYGSACPFGGYNVYRQVGGIDPNPDIAIDPYGNKYQDYQQIYASVVYFCPNQ